MCSKPTLLYSLRARVFDLSTVRVTNPAPRVPPRKHSFSHFPAKALTLDAVCQPYAENRSVGFHAQYECVAAYQAGLIEQANGNVRSVLGIPQMILEHLLGYDISKRPKSRRDRLRKAGVEIHQRSNVHLCKLADFDSSYLVRKWRLAESGKLGTSPRTSCFGCANITLAIDSRAFFGCRHIFCRLSEKGGTTIVFAAS